MVSIIRDLRNETLAGWIIDVHSGKCCPIQAASGLQKRVLCSRSERPAGKSHSQTPGKQRRALDVDVTTASWCYGDHCICGSTKRNAASNGDCLFRCQRSLHGRGCAVGYRAAAGQRSRLPDVESIRADCSAIIDFQETSATGSANIASYG